MSSSSGRNPLIVGRGKSSQKSKTGRFPLKLTVPRIYIWASHFSPEIGGEVTETVASTPTYEPGVVTLFHIFSTSFPATIAIDPGATIQMSLVRRDGGTDGSITEFNCTLGGFMEEVP